LLRRLVLYTQIARLARNVPIDEKPIREQRNRARAANSDFAARHLCHLLHASKSKQCPGRLGNETLVQDMQSVLLAFQYWYNDERDNTQMGSISEHHQITYHAAEYLAGQLFPSQVFTS